MTTSTGDIKNNIEKLEQQLRSIHYSNTLETQALLQGKPEVFLPLLDYVLLGFSSFLARYIVSKGYELYNKSDLKFVESIYRLLRDEYQYKPALSSFQFLSNGFAERKIMMLSDIITISKKKHNELMRIEKKNHKVALGKENEPNSKVKVVREAAKEPLKEAKGSPTTKTKPAPELKPRAKSPVKEQTHDQEPQKNPAPWKNEYIQKVRFLEMELDSQKNQNAQVLAAADELRQQISYLQGTVIKGLEARISELEKTVKSQQIRSEKSYPEHSDIKDQNPAKERLKPAFNQVPSRDTSYPSKVFAERTFAKTEYTSASVDIPSRNYTKPMYFNNYLPKESKEPTAKVQAPSAATTSKYVTQTPVEDIGIRESPTITADSLGISNEVKSKPPMTSDSDIIIDDDYQAFYVPRKTDNDTQSFIEQIAAKMKQSERYLAGVQ